jgi:hypothetical protein
MKEVNYIFVNRKWEGKYPLIGIYPFGSRISQKRIACWILVVAVDIY